VPTHNPELRSGAHRDLLLERLRPYARNAKTHGNDQVAKTAASMPQVGWTVPVLVASNGDAITYFDFLRGNLEGGEGSDRHYAPQPTAT
jgi:hypothetical protein